MLKDEKDCQNKQLPVRGKKDNREKIIVLKGVVGAARNSRNTDGCFGQWGRGKLHAQSFEEEWNGTETNGNIRSATNFGDDGVVLVPRKRQQDGQQVDE